jgi:hypothetical protein
MEMSISTSYFCAAGELNFGELFYLENGEDKTLCMVLADGSCSTDDDTPNLEREGAILCVAIGDGYPAPFYVTNHTDVHPVRAHLMVQPPHP